MSVPGYATALSHEGNQCVYPKVAAWPCCDAWHECHVTVTITVTKFSSRYVVSAVTFLYNRMVTLDRKRHHIVTQRTPNGGLSKRIYPAFTLKSNECTITYTITRHYWSNLVPLLKLELSAVKREELANRMVGERKMVRSQFPSVILEENLLISHWLSIKVTHKPFYFVKYF